jgi:hypothetical protein
MWKPKGKYSKAATCGAFVGFAALFTASMLPLEEWKIPNWDSWGRLDFGPEFVLVHQALFLRFLMILLESGCPVVIGSAVLAVALLKIDEYGEKHAFVQAMSWSAQFTFAIACGAAILVCLICPLGLVETSVEQMILSRWLAFVSTLVVGTIFCVWPVLWAVLTFVIWTCEKAGRQNGLADRRHSKH